MSTERPILFSGAMVRAILSGAKSVTRRVVKPGAGQKWLTPETLSRVERWEYRGDGYWSMQIGEPNRIVHCGVEMDGGHIGCVRCPYGQQRGDILWVRETWQHADWTEDGQPYIRYRADDSVQLLPGADDESLIDVWATLSDSDNFDIDGKAADRKWRPSIFMPRWASRITLEVTGVRVERLQEISEEEAKAEGARYFDGGEIHHSGWRHDDGDVYSSARASFFALWQSINGKTYPWASNPWVWVVEFRRAA